MVTKRKTSSGKTIKKKTANKKTTTKKTVKKTTTTTIKTNKKKTTTTTTTQKSNKNKFIKKIIGTLNNNNWRGTAINGTKYVQWEATSDFFELWKKYKNKIKDLKFSLYKDPERGWVVTWFDPPTNIKTKFKSYDAYKKYLEKIEYENLKDELLGTVEEYLYKVSDRKSKRELYQALKDINKAKNLDDLYSIMNYYNLD